MSSSSLQVRTSGSPGAGNGGRSATPSVRGSQQSRPSSSRSSSVASSRGGKKAEEQVRLVGTHYVSRY